MACLSTSYGCAPTTRYLSAKTSAGTPSRPYSCASSISADTCASKAGSASTSSKCSPERPTCCAISFSTFLSSIERPCCQYASIIALWKAPPFPCDSAYFSAMSAGRLSIHAGPFGIDSRPALIAEKYAESQGKGGAFHKAIMLAYWQQGRSIDDKNVLKEIAQQVGLSGEHFDEVLADPAFDAQVSADIELAHEYGLDGVPALVFADRYLVVGAQPYEVLKQAIEQIQDEP